MLLYIFHKQQHARNTFLSLEDLILTAKSKMKMSHATNITKKRVREELKLVFGDAAESMIKILEFGHNFIKLFRSKTRLKREHISHIDEMAELIRSWKNENQTQKRKEHNLNFRSKLVYGLNDDFLSTFEAMTRIFYESLMSGISIIPNSISQNPVENLFSLIRSFCGSISNPTLQQCETALRVIIFLQDVSPSSCSLSYQKDTITFNESDTEYFEKRLNKLKDKHKDLPVLLSLVHIELESILDVITRIVKAVQRKKKYSVKDESKVLQDIVFTAYTLCNSDNL